MGVTITIVQIFVCLAALATVGVLQSMAANNIRSSPKYSNASVKNAFNLLVTGAVIAFITFVLGITIMIMVFNARESLSQHMSKLVYLGIISVGSLLLVSSALGVRAAITLQCFIDEGDEDLKTAWNYSTITSLIGILGVFAMLIVQFFAHTDCSLALDPKKEAANAAWQAINSKKSEMTSGKRWMPFYEDL